MKVLVAGWFSFVDGHATAGDLLVRDVACEWLDEMGYDYDVAVAPPFSGGLDWRSVEPTDYTHVVFVCGPFQRSGHELELLERFWGCRLVGLDLSMAEPLSSWNPFDLLLERDSSEIVRPDLAFLSRADSVPVVGLCLVESYPGARVREANEAFDRLIGSREMAVVRIDTRLDAGCDNPLRTPGEITSLIGRADVLLTTRLHGLVLALKSGIPAIAIDPEPGGAKIRRQAELLDWPYAFVADGLDDRALEVALAQCLTEDSRVKARECGERARRLLDETFEEFREGMGGLGSMEERYEARSAAAGGLGSVGGRPRGSPRSWWQWLRGGWMKMRRRPDVRKR